MTQPTQAEATLNSAEALDERLPPKVGRIEVQNYHEELKLGKSCGCCHWHCCCCRYFAAADIVVVAVAAAAPNNSGRVSKKNTQYQHIIYTYLHTHTQLKWNEKKKKLLGKPWRRRRRWRLRQRQRSTLCMPTQVIKQLAFRLPFTYMSRTVFPIKIQILYFALFPSKRFQSGDFTAM